MIFDYVESKMISNIEFSVVIDLNCAFYDKCPLPKRNSLCECFPNYTICPEYQTKRENLHF